MKCVLLAFCISFVIVAEAAVAREQFNPNISHSGHCYTSSFNIGPMKEGEKRQPKTQCVEVICGSGENRDVTYFSCGVSLGPGCHLSDYDLTKPYPECCKQLIC